MTDILYLVIIAEAIVIVWLFALVRYYRAEYRDLEDKYRKRGYFFTGEPPRHYP